MVSGLYRAGLQCVLLLASNCQSGAWQKMVKYPKAQQISCRSNYATHYASTDGNGHYMTRTVRDGYGDSGWIKGSSFVAYGETNLLATGIRGRSLMQNNASEYLCMSEWII